MAGKEKRAGSSRQINKDDKNQTKLTLAGLPRKKPGPKPNAAKKAVVKAKVRGSARGKVDLPPIPDAATSSEDSKPGTPRSRKQFLEKELEDLLENATGRNTPLDNRPGFFLPKSRREPEDDTLSVRSLTAFHRTPKRAADRELEDDVLSLRSVKLRKDDDDTMSVKSLPGKQRQKPGRKPGKEPTLPQKKLVKPKKPAAGKAPAALVVPRKKTLKTKEKSEKNKNIKRLQNKIVAKRRSNMMLTKKVRNAKIAVKRIYKKKAEKAAVTPTVATTTEKVSDTVIPEVVQQNGDIQHVAPETVATPPPRRKLIRGPLKDGSSVSAPSSPVNSAIGTRKRRWTHSTRLKSVPSSDESSVISTQPRMTPTVKKGNSNPPTSRGKKSGSSKVTENPPVEAEPLSAEQKIEPSANSTDTATTTTATSTPYFIQTVPSLNALMSQPTARGDWLVTPSGVVLIQVSLPPSFLSCLTLVNDTANFVIR